MGKILNMKPTKLFKKDVMRNNDFYNGLSDRQLKVLIVLVALLIGWICIQGGSAHAQTTPSTISPNLQEVIKLTKAHMTDDVILAYIHNSAIAYNLSADDVLYLNGQGVSQPVISALLQSKATAPLPTPAPDASTRLSSTVSVFGVGSPSFGEPAGRTEHSGSPDFGIVIRAVAWVGSDVAVFSKTNCPRA